MEWFNQKTSIAGIQVSNWIIALGAIIVIFASLKGGSEQLNRPLLGRSAIQVTTDRTGEWSVHSCRADPIKRAPERGKLSQGAEQQG